MNKLVIVQKPVTENNPLNEPVKTWVWHCKAWAEIKPLQATERLQGAVEEAKASYKVKVRNSSDTAGITADMRLQSAVGVLHIIGQPVQLYDYVEMICEVRSIER